MFIRYNMTPQPQCLIFSGWIPWRLTYWNHLAIVLFKHTYLTRIVFTSQQKLITNKNRLFSINRSVFHITALQQCRAFLLCPTVSFTRQTPCKSKEFRTTTDKRVDAAKHLSTPIVYALMRAIEWQFGIQTCSMFK